MADRTFSELPVQSGPVPATAIVPIEYGGATLQTTAQDIANLTPGSSPAGSTKQVQFNNLGAFGAEAGFEYDSATDTLTVKNLTAGALGLILTVAAAATGAGFRMPPGVAPTSPVDGDMWTTTAGLFARINGSTVGPYGAGSAGTVTSLTASGGLQTTTGSPITTSGTVQGAYVVNTQTGTSYALLAADRGKHLTLSNAAAISVTLSQAGTTGFEDGWFFFVENIGVGNATITPATSTINGAANVALNGGMSAIVFSDGTNYRAIIWQRGSALVNSQTGTSYTVLSSDRGKLVTFANASAIGVTLPNATGAFGAGWSAWFQNTGAGTVSLSPTTATIDGAAVLTLTTDQGIFVASDGTNYFTMRGRPSASSSLVAFTEALNTSGVNATINASSLTASGGTASQGLVLAWKGTGGYLSLHLPDGTSTGGNSRGAGAIDFQTSRSTAAQIASGIRSMLLATQNCTVTGTNSAGLAALTSTIAGNQTAVIGDSITSTASNTLLLGSYASDRGLQSLVLASGSSSIGRRQNQRVSQFTTSAFSATARILSTTGSNSGEIALPNNSVYGCSARVVVRGGSDYYDGIINFTCYRGANAAATVVNGVTTAIVATQVYATAGVAGLGWVIDVIADTTNGGFNVRVKADSGQIVDSTTTVDMTEMVP